MNPIPDIDLLGFQQSLKLSRDDHGASTVYDPVRKKYIRATPEEIVRQLWLIYFLDELNINPKLIAVERSIVINGMQRRFDLVVFSKSTAPLLLVELKAPDIHLNQNAFDQIAQYNMGMRVPYSLVSNGDKHFCFTINDQEKKFTFLSQLPKLNEGQIQDKYPDKAGDPTTQ